MKLHFSPSNLMPNDDLLDADLLTQLNKLVPPESFGQDICNLIISTHVIDIHLSGFNAFPRVVEFGVDVLATPMVHWILEQDDGRLVVHH